MDASVAAALNTIGKAQAKQAQKAALVYDKAVRSMMKKHPHIAHDLWRHACTLLGETPKEAQSGPAAGQPSNTGPVEVESKTLGRSKKVKDLSVADLKKVLYRMDPVALSPFALKAMARRGAREVSKDNLTKLFEYLTGIAAAFVLDAPFNILEEFMKYSVEMYKRNGRLASSLVLPPDWGNVGHWKVVPAQIRPRDLHITCCRMNDTRLCVWPHDVAGAVLRLIMDMNWSENAATITEKGTMNSETVKSLWATGSRMLAPDDASFCTPQKKRAISPPGFF